MTDNNAKLSGMVRHAMRMMAGTFASRILGLIREVITAALFGATRQLDAFYIAYTLANLLRQLLAEGALSASFVPVFCGTLTKDGKGKAGDLARQAMTVLLIAGLAVTMLGIALAPLLVSIMAPGFSPSESSLAVSLTRLMFPFLLLVSVGALAMGVLNSLGCFFVPAVAPALSNAAYILFLLVTMRHASIWNLAIAVLIGGTCQMLLQWYWCSRLGVALYPSMPQKENSELKNMMALFLPYAAGLSLNQINPVISRMFGSFLPGGSISVLSYADRILQLPLGLFVIAISQAVLPMLSRQDQENRAGFRDFISDALRFNLFIVVPVAAGLFIISEELVHLIFFRGAFTEWAWHATATALALYGLGLPGMASNTVIMRAIYARKMPRAAVSITAVTVIVNLCASFLLMPRFAYAGLAAASAIAFTCAPLYGGWSLSRSLREPLRLFNAVWLVKIASSCAIMALSLMALRGFIPYPAASGLSARALWVCAAVSVGAVTYCATTTAIGCQEWQWIKEALRNKKNTKQEDETL